MTGQPTAPSNASDEAATGDAYQRLISMLDAERARYRIIDHAPEGRTEVVSAYRGNPLAAAAKCLVVMVKIGKRTSRYYLAVVPGDARVDLQALKAMAGGTYVSFASPDRAEALAGSISGTILPFSFHPDLIPVADPALLANEEIFFNAARLDRSLALDAQDYARLANPQLHPITASADSTV